MKCRPTEATRAFVCIALGGVVCLAICIATGCVSNHAQQAAQQPSDQTALERTIFADMLNSGAIRPADDSHYFLSLPDRADPSPAMIAQLRKTASVATVSVDPVSKAPSRDEWLNGSSNGDNAVLQINSIQWLDANTATAEAFETHTPMSGIAYRYTITRTGLTWHVTRKEPVGAA